MNPHAIFVRLSPTTVEGDIPLDAWRAVIVVNGVTYVDVVRHEQQHATDEAWVEFRRKVHHDRSGF